MGISSYRLPKATNWIAIDVNSLANEIKGANVFQSTSSITNNIFGQFNQLHDLTPITVIYHDKSQKSSCMNAFKNNEGFNSSLNPKNKLNKKKNKICNNLINKENILFLIIVTIMIILIIGKKNRKI